MTGIQELIQEAKVNPPKPIVAGLLNESETAGLHGPPETFKTIFCIQLAESLALGTPLLGIWPVPQPLTVYLFETEMSVPALGTRLARMFAGRTPPGGIHLADQPRLRAFRRAPNLLGKFKLLSEWVAEAKVDVVIVDTCNPFFRGKESPNDETTAGSFFDLLETLPAPTKLFVRHNHKRRMEDSNEDAAAKIRGSGQFSDVPDLLLELRRKDKRTHEATLAVTKFRHGTKPEDLLIWFDSGDFRLISVPPVVHLLQAGPLSRAELLDLLHTRFSIAQRLADEMISDQRSLLVDRQEGHRRVFEIDWSAAPGAEWYPRLGCQREVVQDMQDCISCTLPLEQLETPLAESPTLPNPSQH